jgi:hypothetical protein
MSLVDSKYNSKKINLSLIFKLVDEIKNQEKLGKLGNYIVPDLKGNRTLKI